MRLHQLDVEGFGMLSKGHFEFDPYGLTVIYGDNERGKTTLKDCICATLFGLQTADEKRRYTPWDSSAGYSATVYLSSGENFYKILREFDTDTVLVKEISHGKEETVFEGVSHPHGRGMEHQRYSDFIGEVTGFTMLDIFHATTFIEQMKSKTAVTNEIRQLISGTEKTDYVKVAEKMESELREITQRFPGVDLKKKRDVETLEERIDALSRRIEEGTRSAQAAGRCRAHIKEVEIQLQELDVARTTKEKGLEALGRYIQIEKELLTIQRELELYEKEVKTILSLKESMTPPRSSVLHKIMPLMTGVLTGTFSAAVLVLTKDPFLAVIVLVPGIALTLIFYLLSVNRGFSSEISRLKTMSELQPRSMENMEADHKRLQREILSLNAEKAALISDYPSFFQADLASLTELQEKIHQDVRNFDENIKIKKEELTELLFELRGLTQNLDLTFLEEERAVLQERLNFLKKRKEALITAMSVLKECISEYHYTYMDELEDLLTRSFRKITNEKYENVSLEPLTLEPFVSTGSKSHIRKESLSIGAQEQLYFAMRLSMAYLLSRRIPLPFLLDDPFVNYDRHRLENARFILSHIRETNQIILFVHDPLYKEWTTSVIDLNEK